MQSVAYFAKRELTCWRDREYNDQYDCLVSTQGDYGVSIKLDVASIRFSDYVAQEIARCIYDAVLVTVGNRAKFVPTPAPRDCVLQRKYRKGISDWHYTADGEFSCREADEETHFSELQADSDTTEGSVGVHTIDGGGIELVFDFMSYSFSMLDAVWLVNTLMEATGGEPLDVLETTCMICRPQGVPIQR
ncbi:hypothetical protein [Pseudomonas sp. BF-B-26]|uniref:hypothetical protein n=1 Tax=Pseudomonas sp. BF-B-26 TaxID=2832400 RepID=UPI001CBEACB3|nr:hypothetical protein [Pseudomonas sp. BF-B-26]